MDTEDDREYSRRVAAQRAMDRMRGRRSGFPSFAVPVGQVDELVESGREEFGHPSTWDEEAPLPDPVKGAPSLCPLGLHKMRGKNVRDGKCHACRLIRVRRKRNAEKGNPLCWTGEHPQLDPDVPCTVCGDEPPDPATVDWIMVERAIDGGVVNRELTTAELGCFLWTVMNRWRIGAWEARSVLHENTGEELSDRQLEYLTTEYEHVGRTTNDVLVAMLAS